MALYERIIFPDPRSLVTCCLYESVDYFLYECHKRFTIKDCRLLFVFCEYPLLHVSILFLEKFISQRYPKTYWVYSWKDYWVGTRRNSLVVRPLGNSSNPENIDSFGRVRSLNEEIHEGC